jgi:uncharacterized protein YbaP (TraB family)
MKTRARIGLLFLVACSIVLVFSCATEKSSPQKPTAGGPASFLFDVTPGSGGGRGRAYVFGSVHLASADNYPLSAVVESAYESADELVVEADVLALDETSMQSLFYRHATYPDGSTLDHHLTISVYALLQKKMKEIGIDFSMFAAWKPWAIALTLESVEYMNLGYDANLGIDVHFIGKARGTKPIRELESIAYQFDLLDSFDDNLQEMFLYSFLLEMDDIEKSAVEIFAAWSTGDTGALEKIVFDERKKQPDLEPLYTKLFTERNARMAEKIAGYLADGKTYFVVIGAGHLVGKGSVIELLRAKGFGVSQR